MTLSEVVPDLYQVSLGTVNAFLLRDSDHLTVIDAGTPEDAESLLAAVREMGYRPSDVQNILVTHAHYDHAGGLAALKEATGAPAWMHPLDAELVRAGRAMRPYQVTPGLLNRILYWVFVRGNPETLQPASIECEVEDGEEIPVAGGLRAIHVPGHSAGQLAFLWPRHGGVLLAGDAAANAMGLQLSLIHEDSDLARASLRALSEETFEVAVFGHGGPIPTQASRQFRTTFGEPTGSPEE
jgi:glyoxylase-like metal-dependent hydrolase (beta-lactamase superfamily II)